MPPRAETYPVRPAPNPSLPANLHGNTALPPLDTYIATPATASAPSAAATPPASASTGSVAMPVVTSPGHPASGGVTPHAASPASASPADTDATGTQGPSRGWIAAIAVVLAAGIVMWLRSRKLADEAQRLALQHRALQNINHRLRNESSELRRKAINDPLTGTLNRQAFAAEFRDLVKHAGHYDLPIHLVIVDMDHFKSINDQMGHLAGDRALKLVAGIMREHLHSADVLGRFGGDEFLIACVERDTEQVRELGERIRIAVASAAQRQAPPLTGLTLSLGIASMRNTGEDSADAVFARADEALYQAKRSGRNQVAVATNETAANTSAFGSTRHL